MQKHLFKILVIVLACLTLVGCSASQKELPQTEKVTLYFGLADATTGEQYVTADEASKQIGQICLDAGVGYTQWDAFGAYRNGDQTISNDTVVFLLMFSTEEQVRQIIDTAKSQLNLSAVLYERTAVQASLQ